MSGVPLPFSISLLLIAALGLAGNVRFLVGNYREKNVHRQLLVLLTSVLLLCCLHDLCDITRVLLGITLTRTSCLRFIGASFSMVSTAQSIVYPLLGVDVLILISNAALYRKLKIWWFHVAVYLSFAFSGWCIYESWMSDEERPLFLCAPVSALTRKVNAVRNKVLLVNSCFIVGQYIAIILILLSKKKGHRDTYHSRIIQTSIILMLVFIRSWFLTAIIITFSNPISRILNVSEFHVLWVAKFASSISYSQTYYVDFFVKSENRKAFREREVLLSFSCLQSSIIQSKRYPSRGNFTLKSRRLLTDE